MIEVIGEEGTNEHRAALTIKKFFEEQWPNISDTPSEEDLVIIRAGTCLSGYKRSDIDLFIAARLCKNRRFRPVRAIKDRNGRIVRGSHIYIKNILAVGEEKSHSTHRVRATGDEIEVYYQKNGWKSATTQNREQLHSMKQYIEAKNLRAYLCNFIFLSNVADRLGSAVNPSMTSAEFFSRLLETGNVMQRGQLYEYHSTRIEMIGKIFELPILRRIMPSNLDRRRMELLAKKSKLVTELATNSSKSLILLAGVGGTGKTITMLQVASSVHTDKAERSLFLTYNTALASDVQRLISLAKIRSEDQEGGIRIQTVYSFFYTLLSKLGLQEGLHEENDGYEDYSTSLEILKDHLNDNIGHVKTLISENPYEFEFDRIFVDEAQDWHQMEAEILKLIYADVTICVADGRQQMVRVQKKANWFQGIAKDDRKFISLNTSLRQKSSLASFISGLAGNLKQEWDSQINPNASGGRIIISTQDYRNSNLHKSLIEEAKNSGIDNLDWLIMVPPERHDKRTSSTMDISNYLRENGQEVIDLFDRVSRKELKPDPKQFRVIQYESCRGLEGWITILHKFDTFIAHKINLETKSDVLSFTKFQELDLEIQELVWNWASMIFSRAMDTLVIHLENPNSGFGRVLMDFSRVNKDLIDVIK